MKKTQGYKSRKDESISMRVKKVRTKKQLKDAANESYGKFGSKAKKSGKINKPTIAEIKRNTKTKAPYFFDAKTMKFFGQRMSDYKVHKCSDGKVYIYAKSFSTDYRTGKPEFMGYTIRQYTGSDLKNTTRKLIEITNC